MAGRLEMHKLHSIPREKDVPCRSLGSRQRPFPTKPDSLVPALVFFAGFDTNTHKTQPSRTEGLKGGQDDAKR